MEQRKTILVIDDDEGINRVLAHMLGDDYQVEVAASGEAGLKRVEDVRPHLVLLDLHMPRMGGLAVLRRLRETWPDIPVVMITAYGKIESAVQAMRLGAIDYLEKPFRLESLKRQLQEWLSPGPWRLAEPVAGREIVGESPPMQAVWRLIQKFSPSDMTILLEGESGTGKELFARVIHERSRRRQGPFVPIDCAALPEAVVESEIFGYEKGAFTGATERKAGRLEWANGGTLFLDEVANIPLTIQGKLLRVIQELKLSPVGARGPTCIDLDVRIIAASNRPLSALVHSGQFRDDLYYRLSAVTVHLPPLRQRAGDIERLARHFLASYGARSGKSEVRLAPETLDLLTGYPWPGNVRELENTIKSAVLLADDIILPTHVPNLLQPARVSPAQRGEEGSDLRLEVGLNLGMEERLDLKAFRGSVAEAAEKELMARVLREGKLKKSQLAAFLSIDPKTLRSKLKKFGLDH